MANQILRRSRQIPFRPACSVIQMPFPSRVPRNACIKDSKTVTSTPSVGLNAASIMSKLGNAILVRRIQIFVRCPTKM